MLENDTSTGSALQEVNFWINLESSLDHIKKQTERKEAELTIKILQNAKRFNTVIFF
jgi:dynein heavy chain 1